MGVFFFCLLFSPSNSAEVAKTEATEARAQQAEAFKTESEELASSLEQEVWYGMVWYAIDPLLLNLPRCFGHSLLGTHGVRKNLLCYIG